MMQKLEGAEKAFKLNLDHDYPSQKGESVDDLMKIKKLNNLPTTCIEIKRNNSKSENGFYLMYSQTKDSDMRAYCVMTEDKPYLIHYIRLKK